MKMPLLTSASTALLTALLFGVIVLNAPRVLVAQTTTPTKPNIVNIVTDDQRLERPAQEALAVIVQLTQSFCSRSDQAACMALQAVPQAQIDLGLLERACAAGNGQACAELDFVTQDLIARAQQLVSMAQREGRQYAPPHQYGYVQRWQAPAQNWDQLQAPSAAVDHHMEKAQEPYIDNLPDGCPHNDPNLCFGWQLNQMTSHFRQQRDESHRLYKECLRGTRSACDALEALNAQMEAESRAMEAKATFLGGMNAADEIRSSVRRQEQSIRDRNYSSQLRQDADDYFRYADQARRRGDLKAAETWQNQGNEALRRSYGYLSRALVNEEMKELVGTGKIEEARLSRASKGIRIPAGCFQPVYLWGL